MTSLAPTSWRYVNNSTTQDALVFSPSVLFEFKAVIAHWYMLPSHAVETFLVLFCSSTPPCASHDTTTRAADARFPYFLRQFVVSMCDKRANLTDALDA